MRFELYTVDLRIVLLCIPIGRYKFFILFFIFFCTNMLPPLQMEAQVPEKCS